MAVKCREPDCRELAAEGGTYCRWHECCAPGCHERRCDAPRAYCPDHDAEHYRRTGHHAFWHETAERPAARSSPEPTPPAATSPGVQTSPEGGEPQPGEEEGAVEVGRFDMALGQVVLGTGAQRLAGELRVVAAEAGEDDDGEPGMALLQPADAFDAACVGQLEVEPRRGQRDRHIAKPGVVGRAPAAPRLEILGVALYPYGASSTTGALARLFRGASSISRTSGSVPTT